MKSLKDFLTEKQQLAVEQPAPEELSLVASTKPLLEGVAGHTIESDPPTVLVMHRKAIRELSEGQRVGVYYVDKINKYITVPLDAPSTIAEETAIDRLFLAVEKKKNIMVEHIDGTSSEVTPQMARDMIELYKKINEANKAKMLDMLESSAKHFQTIAKFSKE
jgi:hypothetical protein